MQKYWKFIVLIVLAFAAGYYLAQRNVDQGVE